MPNSKLEFKCTPSFTDIISINSEEIDSLSLRDFTNNKVDGIKWFRGEFDANEWKDITSIAVAYDHIVGLKHDETVIATGENKYGQCNVGNWLGVISVAVGSGYSVGLKRDGTVVAAGFLTTGSYYSNSLTRVRRLENIVGVGSAGGHITALTADGKVIQIGGGYATKRWNDISSIAVGGCNTIGLKSDGTVVSGTAYWQDQQLDVKDWKDIVSVAAGYDHIVGLKCDGTVVATGKDYAGQCNVNRWSNIASIAAGDNYTVGLKLDGTVVTTDGNRSIEKWRQIVTIGASKCFTFGLYNSNLSGFEPSLDKDFTGFEPVIE